MMGTSHATSGALGWLLIGPGVAAFMASPLEGKELVAGMVACAGAALLPDLDHPKATIAQTLGPVTHALARGVSLLAGGHRQGTHSLVFAIGMGLVTQALVSWSATAAILIMWFMTALALRSLHLVPPRTSHSIKGLVIAGEATLIVWAMTVYMPGEWWWLGIAVGVGCFIHLLGDCLTPEGVPFLWPMRWRGSLPVIPHTGSPLETMIITPLMAVATVYLLWRNVAEPWITQNGTSFLPWT